MKVMKVNRAKFINDEDDYTLDLTLPESINKKKVKKVNEKQIFSKTKVSVSKNINEKKLPIDEYSDILKDLK